MKFNNHHSHRRSLKDILVGLLVMLAFLTVIREAKAFTNAPPCDPLTLAESCFWDGLTPLVQAGSLASCSSTNLLRSSLLLAFDVSFQQSKLYPPSNLPPIDYFTNESAKIINDPSFSCLASDKSQALNVDLPALFNKCAAILMSPPSCTTDVSTTAAIINEEDSSTDTSSDNSGVAASGCSIGMITGGQGSSLGLLLLTIPMVVAHGLKRSRKEMV